MSADSDGRPILLPAARARANARELDHYTPALWSFENPAFLDATDAGTNATLDRADKLIKDLNALLP